MRFQRRLGALLGAAVMLAGCGTSQPASRAEPTPRLAGAVFHDARHESDGVVLSEARQQLIRRCMVRRGFAYRVAAALPAPVDVQPPDPSTGYTLSARFAGVRPAVLAAARRRARDPNERSREALPPARRAAYDRTLDGSVRRTRIVRVSGVPAFRYETGGGCYGRAIAQLHGGVDAYYRDIARQNVVAMTINRRLSGETGLRHAAGAWQSCMAARGLRFRSPADARIALYDAYVEAADLAATRRRELATAAADRACGDTSRFYREQERARDRALRSLSAEQVDWVLDSARRRAAAAERARAVLGH